jgi:hypothetical protein
MEITVTLRESKKLESKVAAHADVVLRSSEGTIQLNSFCVFKPNGKPAWVGAPGTKGERRFFPLIVMSGEIRKRVETAILVEYQRQMDAAAKKF